MTKVEKIMFETAFNFYMKVGRTEEMATKLALDDIKRKMDIPEERWYDITTGNMVDIVELERG